MRRIRIATYFIAPQRQFLFIFKRTLAIFFSLYMEGIIPKALNGMSIWIALISSFNYSEIKRLHSVKHLFS